jgi:phage gp29-like protein
MIFDAFGREVTMTRRPVTDEIVVSSVRDRYNSYPAQGLTPENLALIFKEADQGDVYRQSEMFEEMEERDAHLGSTLQTRKLAIQGLSWEILPASESPEDSKIADAAKEMVEYIEDFEGGLLDIMDALGKGFSVSEIMWEFAERRWWIKSLNWVHQKRLTFSGPPTAEDLGRGNASPLLKLPRLLTETEQVWGEELMPYKFIYHRAKSRSGIAPRGGLLRPCAYMYLFKNYDIKDWLIFNELYSVPMRIGKYAASATPAEKTALRQAVFNLGVDAAAIVSDSTVIELLESKVRGETSAFKDLADFCDKAMSKAVLGHTGSSEGTPGKLGSEDSANEVRQDILEADAKALMKTLRAQLLAPWVVYNFGPDKGVPQFKFHFEGEEDLEKIARTYGILVKDVNYKGIGVKHIADRFGIPQPEKGEETVSAVVTPNPFDVEAKDRKIGSAEETATQKNKGALPSKEKHLPMIESQQSVDNLADNALDAGEIDIETMKNLIEQATSYEDLQQRIKGAYGSLDMKQFRTVMEQAMFMADIAGRSLNVRG